MKIALIGYGQMGQMVEKVAQAKGHTIVAKTSSTLWDEEGIVQADVCIEFTHPESVLSHIDRLAKLGKNSVIGTTGWYDQMDQVKAIIENNQVGAVYSPNFSIGVQLTFQLLEQASRLMSPFKQYDVAGIEYHHHKKKDMPSGTGLEMSRIVEQNLGRDLHFSCVRCGSIPGTHTVMFDSPYDTISITHEARTREGFALGAVQAAEWLQGRQGLYSFSDCMKDILKEAVS